MTTQPLGELARKLPSQPLHCAKRSVISRYRIDYRFPCTYHTGFEHYYSMLGGIAVMERFRLENPTLIFDGCTYVGYALVVDAQSKPEGGIVC